MEVKINCACGTRYKFDVEPVNGRMPTRVACPNCAADGTEQANQIIQQAAIAAILQQNESLAAAPEPEPNPPADPKPGLRLTQAPAHSNPAPPPIPAAPIAPQTRFVSPPQKSKSNIAAGFKRLVAGVCIVLAVAGVGLKWYKRAKRIGGIASAIAASPETSADEKHWNLWADDSVVLMVQANDQNQIAQLFTEFFKTNLKKKLVTLSTNEPGNAQHLYAITPPHNGFVEIIGGLDWPKPQFEQLAQFLSEKSGGLVVVHRDVDFSGAFVFGVYEQGARKFRAEMVALITNNDVEEKVTTDGDQWAIDHGYKPGPNGFKEFNIADADATTKNLGMKLWDRPDQDEAKQIFMAEK